MRNSLLVLQLWYGCVQAMQMFCFTDCRFLILQFLFFCVFLFVFCFSALSCLSGEMICTKCVYCVYFKYGLPLAFLWQVFTFINNFVSRSPDAITQSKLLAIFGFLFDNRVFYTFGGHQHYLTGNVSLYIERLHKRLSFNFGLRSARRKLVMNIMSHNCDINTYIT